jgi:hypothetical protein
MYEFFAKVGLGYSNTPSKISHKIKSLEFYYKFVIRKSALAHSNFKNLFIETELSIIETLL